MINYLEFLDKKIWFLLSSIPKLKEYLDTNWVDYSKKDELSLKDFFNSFTDNFYIEKATTKQILSSGFYEFYINLIKQNNNNLLLDVHEITIEVWKNKYWIDENFSSLTIKRWEVISIVWPTWSWKSRLLADIEWMACKDTPTNRTIFVNWILPPKELRYSSDFKLVAQLTQNMNFIMDLTVEDFLSLHAESRNISDIENTVKKIIEEANKLSWESFDWKTFITSLSWWQSRALMIADIAILSKSPIVLIDEIENAWVDRKKALSLLLREDKIVLIATHDPILALSWNKRIVLKDGWINNIIEVKEEEKAILLKLEELDKSILFYRDKLRKWERLI